MASLSVDESSSSSSSVTASPGASRYQHTPYYCEENVYLLCKKLIEDGIAKSDGSDLFVVFISNEKKQIPLWHQRASHRADGVILWDYHVICVQKRKDSNLLHLVWDLDSSLPFPSPLSTYIAETFRPSFQLFSEFQSGAPRRGSDVRFCICLLGIETMKTWWRELKGEKKKKGLVGKKENKKRVFRVVHAPIFLRSFASDRRHMKDSDGNWVAPPPTYESIVAEDGMVHNLNEYMEMSSVDVVKSIGTDTVDAVLTQKFGVLVSESHLEEFFNQIS